MSEAGQGLETVDLTVRYGGVTAVNNVSLTVRPGEVVGLIGPNGAGKTSFIDAVTGFAPANGDVRVAGTSVGGWAPHRRSAEGLSRTWQQGELFEDLPIEGNLTVAQRGITPASILWDLIRRHKGASKQVTDVLDRLGISDLADLRPSEVSIGHQKLVGVGRALVNAPHVLLLDEPAAGLDTEESLALGEVIRREAGLGIAVLLVEHDIALVREVCDRLYVMDYGKVLASGSTAEVIESPEVIAAYLGSSAGEAV